MGAGSKMFSYGGQLKPLGTDSPSFAVLTNFRVWDRTHPQPYWKKLTGDPKTMPAGRYGHTMVTLVDQHTRKETVILYGLTDLVSPPLLVALMCDVLTVVLGSGSI